MFTRMRMKNFKSWVDTGDVRLAPLTAIFGANSSGKSSLLQMMMLLKQTTESNDRRLVLKTGNLQDGYVNLGSAAEITYRDSTELGFDVSWRLPKVADENVIRATKRNSDQSIEIRELHFSTLIHADGHALYLERMSYLADQFEAKMSRVTIGSDEAEYAIEVKVAGETPKRPQARPRVGLLPEKCYGFGDEAIRYYQSTAYLSDIVLAFEQQFGRVHYLGPLRGYPQRTYNWAGERPSDVGMTGERAVSALLASKNQTVYPGRKGARQQKFERRIAQWFVEMGMASSFETRQLMAGSNQYEVRLKRTPDGHEVLIPDMGFGVSQVLPVLVLCYYAPPGSTLIFEQPEIHLHPAVQSVLADVFIDVMKNRQIQLIIESHSEHLLRRLQRRIAEEQLAPDDVALYFCEMADGQSTIRELEVDMFGTIRNWPRDFFGDLTGELLEIAQNGIVRQIANGHR